MDVNLMVIIIMAIVLTVLYGFLDALRIAITTKVWDYGYLIATFIYAVAIGIIAGMSGLLNLTMPVDQMGTIVMGVWAAYFGYLAAIHMVVDYIIAKLFPEKAPQGLGTAFMKPEKKQMLVIRK